MHHSLSYDEVRKNDDFITDSVLDSISLLFIDALFGKKITMQKIIIGK